MSKVWDDVDNLNGRRPGSVTVQLYAGGMAVGGKTLVLNEDKRWKGAFSDLPMNQGGTPIVYTVSEVEVPAGYSVTISGDARTGFTLTNKYAGGGAGINKYPRPTEGKIVYTEPSGMEQKAVPAAKLPRTGESGNMPQSCLLLGLAAVLLLRGKYRR